nr:DNA gyrase inhibitor YacG [Moraxella macacae]
MTQNPANNFANNNLANDQPHSKTQTYPCPQCKTITTWQNNAFKPFCSERCQLLDFGAWANEDYKITQEMTFDPFID